ncbi:TetR/AcrR family transcriptional regulator [Sphingomonas gilva]|uniref:TetR/AcrR family transcriptional regulator n=1 Tax=Sphingomonas gilva TaxID=2305907 RepID=A0A396RSS2_9SPHN|nr:TetR/AcrR family transcriptional regulator [Sphingomonas gilva]RHW16641.1 TetR/AcrR family transcriptional regulator [Sphingomonas gilva]
MQDAILNGTDARGETDRYRAKREMIVAAASEVMNEQSAKGLTFADVARRVGLNTTSITYYFKRKDDLASACFDRTLDRFEEVLDAAMALPAPPERVDHFLGAHFDRLERQAQGQEGELAGLSDLRAMDEPTRGRLMARWRQVFRKTRELFGQGDCRATKDLQSARAHVLLENVLWLNAWIRRYEIDQYGRVRERLMQVLRHGIAVPGAAWKPDIWPVGEPAATSEPSRTSFLLAATRLINELGYRGASVQRIASELNVTKGSFYHHLDAKDDLVIECFKRSFETISETQRHADASGGDEWHRISSTIATLLDFQFSERGPLLRTSALAALPPRVRYQMIERSNGIARRFAGMLSDGISEGSIRPIDPLIAAQAIMASQNAAFDLRKWAASMEPELAIRLYASTICYGLFDDGVI